MWSAGGCRSREVAQRKSSAPRFRVPTQTPRVNEPTASTRRKGASRQPSLSPLERLRAHERFGAEALAHRTVGAEAKAVVPAAGNRRSDLGDRSSARFVGRRRSSPPRTSIDARADYCFDPGASTKAASTRCALVATSGCMASAGGTPPLLWSRSSGGPAGEVSLTSPPACRG
jgi:hypothetical protein